jgi:hypothetical protein
MAKSGRSCGETAKQAVACGKGCCFARAASSQAGLAVKECTQLSCLGADCTCDQRGFGSGDGVIDGTIAFILPQLFRNQMLHNRIGIAQPRQQMGFMDGEKMILKAQRLPAQLAQVFLGALILPLAAIMLMDITRVSRTTLIVAARSDL